MSKSGENHFPVTELKGGANSTIKSEDQEQKYDPLFYCRTCASKDAFFVPIFKGEGLNHQLNKKIEKYLPIHVTVDDDLPLQLCYNCASTIIAWDALVIGCVEAEKKLKSLKYGTNSDCMDTVNEGILNEGDEPCTIESDNVDSDDEPLIAKKLAVTKNYKRSRRSKKEALNEKVENDGSCQQTQTGTERETKRRTLKKITDIDKNSSGSDSNGAQTDLENSERENENIGKVDYRCPVCFKTFFASTSFCDDLYTHLGEYRAVTNKDSTENRCGICSERVDKMCELPEHLLSHMDMKRMKVPEGRGNSKRKKKKKKGLVGDAPFKSTCEICGKTVSRKYTMKRHLITHSGEKRFTCHHCGKQYAQESGLQRHMSVIHEGIRKYKCPICSKVFGSNYELKTHQYTHPDPRPFQCDQCGRTFVCQKHLYHHRKYHHTVNGLRQLCKICNKYFSSPGVLKRHHKVIHLGLKEFQCHVCSAQLSTKQYLQEHLKIHTDERPEVCSFCGKTFQMTGNLRQHMKIHMEKTQICDICGKGFTRRCHLLTHMGSHKGIEQPQCQICEKRFLLKMDLEKHLKNDHSSKDLLPENFHAQENILKEILVPEKPTQVADKIPEKHLESSNQEEYDSGSDWSRDVTNPEVEIQKPEGQNRGNQSKRVFQCNICNKVLNRRFNFERHLLVHSGETLTCHACGKQYRGQSVLDRHIKVIHQQLRVPSMNCDFCGKGFSSRQSLEDHFRTHTGERPFICEICGKDFRARPNLIAHKKIHSGEFPFSCNICGYKCRLKGTFTDHCQRHEGKRTCLCSICGKGFVNNYDLSKHKKTHSKDRMFSCGSCNLTFVMKRYLKVHMKTHVQKIEGKSATFKNALF